MKSIIHICCNGNCVMEEISKLARHRRSTVNATNRIVVIGDEEHRFLNGLDPYLTERLRGIRISSYLTCGNFTIYGELRNFLNSQVRP